MKTEQFQVEKLKTHPKNPRVHGEENMAALMQSLTKFGQQKPIVVNMRGQVIAGNGTLEAARRLGWKAISGFRTKLDDRAQLEYMIADNKTNELSKWDFAALRDILEADKKVEMIGFSSHEMTVIQPRKMFDKTEQSSDEEDATRFGILIECTDENNQRELLERFLEEKLPCRAYLY